ncbi:MULTISPECIES: fumarylacetoacetate hydrolase family protein [unclassified Gordonia (in: high G+C Gram-positive bacteria)]|uniref:2-keto-4-pentenoate hydratase n=1 Tax=unclassified Gordonia (in: high G+C Gram-positive bacteria) TaxID=2657482 RepID=UPI0009AD4383|nr:MULTISPECIES: fumarylacetoacetate hydrolase family protein [unclassified Gordonia (in: high G+C Gram-positive bacteria)]MDF3285188.1 fumarylacetoacetate hydrolase family protein [Gordonia sp. N1V]OPX11411.1 2-keto-4-pentenoate hydratase [Gordonia sp. i37]
MTLTTDQVGHWADRLHQALSTSTPIEPPTESVPDLDVATAYAIQQYNLTRQLDSGASLVGRKIGLTSAPMQQLLGVDSPDFGFILDSMVTPDGGTISSAALCAPRVEPEIAFRLHRPLRGPGVTVADVIEATDAVAAALEIVDSRVSDWRITLPDTVADNASSGAVALGPWVPIGQAPDLDEVAASLMINGDIVDSGIATAVLGHPAEAVAWLANALADYDTGIDAGQFVMSGSITSAVFVHTGDTAAADLTGLGRVAVTFV